MKTRKVLNQMSEMLEIELVALNNKIKSNPKASSKQKQHWQTDLEEMAFLRKKLDAFKDKFDERVVMCSLNKFSTF